MRVNTIVFITMVCVYRPDAIACAWLVVRCRVDAACCGVVLGGLC